MKSTRYIAVGIFFAAALTFTGCSSKDNLGNNAARGLDGYSSGYNSDYNDGIYGNSDYNGNGYTGSAYGNSDYNGYSSDNAHTGYSGTYSGAYDTTYGMGGYNTGYGTAYNGTTGMPYTQTTTTGQTE